MKEPIHVLIVDDHPVIVEAFIIMFTIRGLEHYEFTIDTAIDCDSGQKKIDESLKKKLYDVIFFDVRMPPSSDGKIVSGEDLAIYAKGVSPSTRIVIYTMFNQDSRIHNILKNVNPDGFMSKTDLSSKDFALAFDTIMKKPPYYSATIIKYFRNQSVKTEDPILDDVNRKIIFHLSVGVKTKDLPSYVNLSLSTVEKRKLHIKTILNIDKANDDEMIEEARKRGLV